MLTKNKKGVFALILVLLMVAIFASVTGIVLKVAGYKVQSDATMGAPVNSDKNFKHEGYLYFYDDNANLIGVYKCENPQALCDYAPLEIDDETYDIRYYKPSVTKTSLINNRYAFIIDSETTDDEKKISKLIDVTTGEVLNNYQAVKNYGVGIEDDIFIVFADNNKWGAISLAGNTPKTLLDYNYIFIGGLSRLNSEGKLIADTLAVILEEYWLIVDQSMGALTDKIYDQLIDYNGSHLVIKFGINCYLYDFNGNKLLLSSGYKDITFTGKYINLLSNSNELLVYNPTTSSYVTPSLSVPLGAEYSVEIVDSMQIRVTIGDNVTTYDV